MCLSNLHGLGNQLIPSAHKISLYWFHGPTCIINGILESFKLFFHNDLVALTGRERMRIRISPKNSNTILANCLNSHRCCTNWQEWRLISYLQVLSIRYTAGNSYISYRSDDSLCICPHIINNFWNNWWIVTKLDMITPLETTSSLHFLISYHWYYQHARYLNFQSGVYHRC
jgi:hypothetical protein